MQKNLEMRQQSINDIYECSILVLILIGRSSWFVSRVFRSTDLLARSDLAQAAPREMFMGL